MHFCPSRQLNSQLVSWPEHFYIQIEGKWQAVSLPALIIFSLPKPPNDWLPSTSSKTDFIYSLYLINKACIINFILSSHSTLWPFNGLIDFLNDRIPTAKCKTSFNKYPTPEFQSSVFFTVSICIHITFSILLHKLAETKFSPKNQICNVGS